MHSAITRVWYRWLAIGLLAVFAHTAGAAAPGGVNAALLAPLAASDTDAKLAAIAALGQLPDPTAARVLEALNTGALFATPAGRVLIGAGSAGGTALDPIDGSTLAMPADAGAITINNRLRLSLIHI